MRKKVIKYSSAGLIFVSLLLVFTISSSAALSGLQKSEYLFPFLIDPIKFNYRDNYYPTNIEISNNTHSDFRHVDIRQFEGYNFLQCQYLIGQFLYEEGDDFSSSGTYAIDTWNRVPIDVSEFISSNGGSELFISNVPIEVTYYVYSYSTSGGVSLYKSQFFNGSKYYDSNVSFIGSLYDSSSNYVLNMYKCTLTMNSYDLDDGTVYWYIRNYSNGSSLLLNRDTVLVEGISLYSGINIVKADEETTTPTIPDRPGPEIIGDQGDKLDQMKDHFEQPAPDLNDAMQHIDPNQMHDISGFFKSDSKFYVFMTALMVIGVSFGLIGYVLHGKRG